MDEVQYAVYGITELFTRKIVYIDYYVYDWNAMEEYPTTQDYINNAMIMMQGDDRGNEYWKDLDNMWCREVKGSEVGVVVLDVVKTENEAQHIKDKYIQKFRPRYNIVDNGINILEIE